jgi:hypothetical protein
VPKIPNQDLDMINELDILILSGVAFPKIIVPYQSKHISLLVSKPHKYYLLGWFELFNHSLAK